MKTHTVRMAAFAAAAAITMAGSAFAGQTQAEREMSKENLRGKAGHEARVRTPDPSDWEYRVALETGSLPSDAGVLSARNGAAVVVPTVEIGGVVYRIGIDTY